MLLIKYIIFAILATGVNLLFQYISFSFYSGFAAIYVGMLCGTLAGLVAKYVLDKKYIFYHQVKNHADDAKKFILYSFMGVITTVIFWGTEIAFDKLIELPNAKYLGAVLGLSVGYIVKYFLDRKYVFR